MLDSGVAESRQLDFNACTRWVQEQYGYPGSDEIAGCEKTILAIGLGMAPEELGWENFPPAESREQQLEAVQFSNALVREFGRLEATT